jgi:protein-tyrosine phosphatase
MDWITSGIAIGSIRDAQDHRTLAAERVDAVLRLLEEAEEEQSLLSWTSSLWLRVTDGRALDPALLRRGVDFLRDQRNVGRKVLVHCGLGQSRSPTFVAAYLHEEGETLLNAFLLIQRARPSALPHPELLRSLVQFYSLPDDPNTLLVKLIQARRLATQRSGRSDA